MKLLQFAFICLVSLQILAWPKINNLQVLATHNSFKRFMDVMIVNTFELFCELSDFGIGDYQHRPLNEQLDRNVRGLEIDIFADPTGGRFREHKVLSMFGADGQSHDPELDIPGYKVMHDANFDFYTTCVRLTTCLQILLDWSNNHPNHLPIFIQFELHTLSTPLPGPLSGFDLSNLGLVDPLPMTKALYDDLDKEILSVLPTSKIIKPDDIRGNFTTLKQAILANSWPEVSSARGKFILILAPQEDSQRLLYSEGHPSQAGRAMFSYTEPENDDAAFIKRDNPEASDLQALVSQGFIVRTRADSEAREAADGNTTLRDLALSSGALLVSTDFIEADPRFYPKNYSVFIPNGNPARCNPIRPGSCIPSDIAE